MHLVASKLEFFANQCTRQPSPFSLDSWMNMMLSLKYWVLRMKQNKK